MIQSYPNELLLPRVNIVSRRIVKVWLTILWGWRLTRSAPIPEEEKKLTYIFIFTLLCGASKGFMKALRAFIKPFEAP